MTAAAEDPHPGDEGVGRVDRGVGPRAGGVGPGDGHEGPAVGGAARPPAGATTTPLVAPGLRVLFCGINPSLRSAGTGHHFAHPANRFWTALHRSGFTGRLLRPDEQDEVLRLGIGVTNIAERATAKASELSVPELRAGAARLTGEVERLRPAWLAVLGVTAYRTAFREPGAGVGPQDRTIGASRVWLLPNPSGLNAHWTPATLAEELARLRAAVPPVPPVPRTTTTGPGAAAPAPQVSPPPPP